MKLKSKLIATIVSMCAAIAVMGVGVWASTSQNFTVTVKNDVDVKIINVNADVYGEFAVYSQFSKGEKTYAKKYTSNQAVKNHGYLLYAIGIGGYNDGLTTGKDTDDPNYDYKVVDKNGDNYGYQKFLFEAKDSVYLATSNGQLDNSRKKDAEGKYEKRDYANYYNVDSLTHTAQITYMYTIKQWDRASESDATNAIYGSLEDVNLSTTATTINDKTGNANGLQGAISGTVNEDGANAQVRINAYISKGGTNWYSLSFDADGTTKFLLDESMQTSSGSSTDYYIILTFTFGRNNANLDLSLLDDALRHSLVLKSEVESTDGYKSYNNTITKGEIENLCSATGRSYGEGGSADSYIITGEAVKTNWAAENISKINGSVTQSFLKNYYALQNPGDTEGELSHLPEGYLYVANADRSDAATSWNWLKDLNNGGRVTNVAKGYAAE